MGRAGLEPAVRFTATALQAAALPLGYLPDDGPDGI